MIEKKQIIYEKVALIGLITPFQDEKKSKEFLDELDFLARSAGAQVVGRFTQSREFPNPKTFVGKGKMEEIKVFVEAEHISTLLFDDELSTKQLKNLEAFFKNIKILDRTQLILDIFAQRAQTSYAKSQVELAQYQYLLPRLTRMWTHLERQKGGIGLRGPGETEIETDRRIIRNRISFLKNKLKSIDKQMATQRKGREKMIRIALIGYTNVGKSLLMNALSKREVFSQDKLFATLDTTVAKTTIKNLSFLLSDTIGFIRKLPTELIESFKSTLDEIREADILLHVVDVSYKNFENHIESVMHILKEIKATEKPIITVFNKVDKYEYEKEAGKTDFIEDLSFNKEEVEIQEKERIKRSYTPSLFVSAYTKENLETLKETIYEQIKEMYLKKFPYDHSIYPLYTS